MIGKIQRVPLREVWKHEALDFTTWLQGNLDVVSDELGISITGAERERAAGDFSVDLVAEDESGNPVVIENQLEKSNHDHLGKLLTYAVAIGADTAIWIVSEARPEHVNAISWLNEFSTVTFHLVKMEAIKVSDSPPAARLTQVVGPSEEIRKIGETKKEWERQDLRYRFWTELLEKARHKTKLHAKKSPIRRNYIGSGWGGSGKRGLGFRYVIRRHDAQADLYIYGGKDSDERNEAIFDSLAASKDEIESRFGGKLDWQRLEDKHACRIVATISLGGLRDEERWPEIQEAMIDNMIRLEKALRPHIAKLRV